MRETKDRRNRPRRLARRELLIVHSLCNPPWGDRKVKVSRRISRWTLNENNFSACGQESGLLRDAAPKDTYSLKSSSIEYSQQQEHMLHSYKPY